MAYKICQAGPKLNPQKIAQDFVDIAKMQNFAKSGHTDEG